MPTKQDWEWLAAGSEYQTAQAIQQLLQEEKWMEASVGLYELIESMGKSKKLALTSQLTRLMAHVIKWKCQPELRSSSWIITIRSARQEIADIQEEVPSLNRNFIESIWDKCFNRAVKDAEDEMGKLCELSALSWEEVLTEEYALFKRN
ncbi:DUF29 domain-containing protein [Argonema galeatum]|uniref:DUF29 domain-containing protein n=1 Tax=Argonema galeatum TaxID=2942762 RepID=UPI002012D9BE|nr:DUF29 domain-containing protein [Argonema galeatum]MCL1467757.1 DUF29 domain-containing protein [Argonema galeatum A003/A1]